MSVAGRETHWCENAQYYEYDYGLGPSLRVSDWSCPIHSPRVILDKPWPRVTTQNSILKCDIGCIRCRVLLQRGR